MKEFGFLSFVSLLFHLMPVLAIEDYQCGDLRVEGTVVAEQVKEQYSMTLQRPGAGRFSRDKHFVEYEVDDIYYACRPGPSVR
uniref:Bgt_avrF2_15 n=1 Tax=Blumeria graminis f. sp. tritici 96224 TaxID=1268274 RepID=A0A381KZ55_BLUGR